MIEALKSDEIIEKAGGRFKLCALIQRRMNQLLEGARPLVAREGRSDLEVVMEEILRGKLTLTYVEDRPQTAPAAVDAGDDLLL